MATKARQAVERGKEAFDSAQAVGGQLVNGGNGGTTEFGNRSGVSDFNTGTRTTGGASAAAESESREHLALCSSLCGASSAFPQDSPVMPCQPLYGHRPCNLAYIAPINTENGIDLQHVVY